MLKLDLQPPEKALIQFGWIGLPGFALLGWIAHAKWGAPQWVFFTLLGLGAAMSICALTRTTTPIRPIFIVMVAIAIPIGFVITNLALLSIWLLLFTPTALLFRLRGKDPLQRAWDGSAKSYWTVRKGPRAPASYLRLY